MPFLGYIQGVSQSGSFPPVTPPSPVLIGRMLIVSSEGIDATGTRDDVVFHYLTIDAALNDAQSGDVVILFPGVHNVTNVNGISVVDSLSVFAFPGVTLTGDPLFVGFRANFILRGYADISCANDNNISSNSGVTNVTYIECNSLTAVNMNNIMGGKLQIVAHEYIRSNTTAAVAWNFVADVLNFPQAYQVRIQSPKTYLKTSAAFSLGIWIADLPTDSNVEIIADIVSESERVIPLIWVSTTFNNVMDFTVKIKGDLIDQETLTVGGFPYAIEASDNTDWGDPVKGYGLYLEGRIITKDKGNIKLNGGRMSFKGDLLSNSTLPVELWSSVVTGTSSILHLSDGTAKSPFGPNVKYMMAGQMVRFKNYTGISLDFLVDNVFPGETYQLLSAYSNNPVNGLTNSIAGTVLIVDAAITI